MLSGVELREAREAAGMSLASLAAVAHLSKSHLSNVENGRRTATPAVVLAYQRALDDLMNRRDVLTGLAAGSLAPMAAANLIREGFAASLATEPRSADGWLSVAEDYGRDYMSTGAAELQARLAGDLVRLNGQLERPALWVVAAKLMTVYGKTLPSNDGSNGAVAWYRLAAAAADRSGDEEARVWVRGRAALALAYEGAALPVAAELAGQALAISDRESLGRLNALTAIAHVTAHGGDHVGSLAVLDEARRTFDRTASAGSAVSDFAVPEWRFATFASMLLSRLADAGAPAAHVAADRARPATLTRFATHIELHRGLYMARSGDKAAGLAYGRAALARLPAARHSLSLRLMLAEVERAAAR